MANIANLSVQLTAKTGQFTSGMMKARRPLQQFVTTMSSAAVKAGLFTSAVVTAAAVGITMLTRQSMEAVDSLAKTADKLGIGTEALGAFRYAAKLAGVEVGQLDKSLQYLIRNSAEAAEGTGEAVDAFRALGIDAKELTKLNTEDRLYVVAEALKNTASAADRAKYAYDIFGRSGMAMVNMLNGGAAGLAEMQKAFEATGAAVSRVDAAKIEQANDAISIMKTAFTGLGNAIAINAAPYLTVFAEDMADLISSKEGVDGITTAFEEMGPAIQFASESVQHLETAIGAFQYETLGALKLWHELLALGEYEKPGVISHKELAKGYAEEQRAIARRMAGNALRESTESRIARYKAEAEAKAKRAKSARDSASMLADESDAESAHTKALADAKRVYDETRTPLEKYYNEISRLNGLLTDGAIDADTHARAVKRAGEEYENAAEAADEFGKRAKAIYDETRTPLEKYSTDLAELNALYLQGKINSQTYYRAMAAGIRGVYEQEPFLKELGDLADQMASDAQNLFDETRTPLEKYQSELEKLNELYREGFIDQDTYSRGIAKANDELAGRADKLKEIRRLEGKFESGKFLASGGFGPRPFGVRSDFAAPINGYGGLMAMPQGSQDMRMTNELLRQIAMNTQNHIARVG